MYLIQLNFNLVLKHLFFYKIKFKYFPVYSYLTFAYIPSYFSNINKNLCDLNFSCYLSELCYFQNKKICVCVQYKFQTKTKSVLNFKLITTKNISEKKKIEHVSRLYLWYTTWIRIWLWCRYSRCFESCTWKSHL